MRASASTRQNEQILNATSGGRSRRRPRSGAGSPSHSVFSIASTVLMKRASSGGRKPTSPISSTLRPVAAAEALGVGLALLAPGVLQDLAADASRRGRARTRARAPGSATRARCAPGGRTRPSTSGENVWAATRCAAPRCRRRAGRARRGLLAIVSSAAQRRRVAAPNRRWSWKICASARMMLP